MSSFRTESMLLKVKSNKSWFPIVGIYRPPKHPKSQWKRELSAIFEDATTISNDTIFLGEEPNKPLMDGRDLCDLLDIYNLKNVITSPTRTTEKTTTISISFLQTTRKEYYHRAWFMSKSVKSLPRIQNFKTLRTQLSVLKSLREKIKSLKAMLSFKICVMLLSM